MSTPPEGLLGEHFALLLATSRLLCSTLDSQQVLATLMAQVVEVLGAERGFIMLREEVGQDWQFRAVSALDPETMAAENFKISLSLVEQVAREGVSVCTSDASEDHRFRDQASVSLYELRSILCVPIIVSQRVLGVIYLDHRLASKAFDSGSQELLEAIANQAAVALENALLYEKLRRAQETSLSAARHELAQMQAQLMQASKMAAVGQLAAGVAHEINNPLCVMAVKLSGMKVHLSKHPVLPTLEVCEAALERCQAIVQRLLTFSQKRSRPENQLDLRSVIESTLELVHPDLRRCAIVLHTQLTSALPVRADATELAQVLLNLILNARDALLSKSEPRNLWVRGRLTEGSPRLAQVEVVDNGPGMTPEIKARIFEPFFTTKGEGQGVGLGLSICHQLLQHHQGTIQVESKAGEGCKFVISLPSDS